MVGLKTTKFSALTLLVGSSQVSSAQSLTALALVAVVVL